MNSYVINLNSAADRMAHMELQFQQLGLDFIRVPATDARAMTLTELEVFRESVAGAYRVHPWSVSQIGNFLSHQEVWRQIAESSDEYSAVFEDDAHFSPSIVPLLNTESWLQPNMDVVRLETTLQSMRLDTRPIRKVGATGIFRLRSEAWGTAGYIIRRQLAEKLCQCDPRIFEPTDWFLFHPKSAVAGQIRIFQAEPAACVQDQYHPDMSHRRNFDKGTLDQVGWASDIAKYSKLLISPLVRKLAGRRSVPFAGRENNKVSRVSQ